MSEQKKPAWWRLYLICALMIALLFAQQSLPVSHIGHQLLELAVTSITIGLMLRWTWRNHEALDEAALLRDVAQRAAERRVTLTPVQTHYLMAQARQIRQHHYGDH